MSHPGVTVTSLTEGGGGGRKAEAGAKAEAETVFILCAEEPVQDADTRLGGLTRSLRTLQKKTNEALTDFIERQENKQVEQGEDPVEWMEEDGDEDEDEEDAPSKAKKNKESSTPP